MTPVCIASALATIDEADDRNLLWTNIQTFTLSHATRMFHVKESTTTRKIRTLRQEWGRIGVDAHVCW